MSHHFNAISVLLRWLAALFGVFATYNPSGYSYYHWLRQDGGSVSLRVLVGVALMIFYVVYLRATLRSLGPIGIGLAVCAVRLDRMAARPMAGRSTFRCRTSSRWPAWRSARRSSGSACPGRRSATGSVASTDSEDVGLGPI